MPFLLIVFLSCLAGVAFSTIGIAYKFGDLVKILPLQSFCFAAFAGGVVYTLKGATGASEAPLYLYVTALGVGFSQYLVVRLVRIILKFGPLSPLWSALMLSFVPTICYSSIFLNEPFTKWNFVALVVAVVAVIAASINTGEPVEITGMASSQGAKRKVIYGVLLVSMMMCNTLLGISMKQLSVLESSDGEPLMERFGVLYLGVMYFALAIPLFIDLCVGKSWNFKPRRWWILALMATFGTMGGMFLQNMMLEYPASLYFTCSSSASVLFTAVFAAVIFREERTKWWYVTITATVMAIIFTNGDAVLMFFGK